MGASSRSDSLMTYARTVPPACEFCNRPMERRLFGDVLEGETRFAVWFCAGCQIAQTVPKPSPEEMEELYATSLYRTENGKRFIGAVEVLITLFNRLKTGMVSRYGKRGSIMDIGCGRGIFLNILKKDGWLTLGVEFNAETASYASRVYGIDVVTIRDMARLPERSFDVITMYHVLEHSDQPVELLKMCRRLLKEGGHLIIAVPNISSLQAKIGRAAWFHLDLPYHLYHFASKGLLQLLQCQGFSIESIRHFDPEQNPYGWLQTLLNRSGIGKNYLYNVLKQRALRTPGGEGSTVRDAVLTVMLLPLYIPLAMFFAAVESALFRRGGTIEVAALYAGRREESGKGGNGT